MALVLCVTFAKNPRPALTWAAPLLRALPPLRLPLALLRYLLLDRWSTESLMALVGTLRREAPASALKGRLLSVMGVDHTALLARIQVPTLCLVASQDRLVPKGATDWIRAHLPNLEIFTGQAPHWLLQTRPEAAAQAIRAFLARSKGRSA